MCAFLLGRTTQNNAVSLKLGGVPKWLGSGLQNRFMWVRIPSSPLGHGVTVSAVDFGSASQGSIPCVPAKTIPTFQKFQKWKVFAFVAQGIEHHSPKVGVEGSNPSESANPV